jgi:NADPH-dependent ferric siderophore reductase
VHPPAPLAILGVMNETTPATTGRRRPVPEDLFGGRLQDCWLLDLEVVGIVDLAPRLRSLRFASPDLVGFSWTAGQDVMFAVPGTEPPLRRRYTIRRTDPANGTMDVEAVLHGDGPFARWVAAVDTGDRIDGIGPRGVVGVRDAPAHLFVGDESAIPVTFVMAEAVPAGTPVTAVVATEDGTALDLSVPAGVEVVWTTADEAVTVLASIGLPDGVAAYVNGERALVKAAAQVLADRGVPSESIATKPYWRRDQANAGHGEPARD